MINIENTEVWGFKHAIRGMRNAMNSWDRSDTEVLYHYCENWKVGENKELDKEYYILLDQDCNIKIGNNDMKLMQNLIKAGSDHRKFLRQIFISVDIVASLYW